MRGQICLFLQHLLQMNITSVTIVKQVLIHQMVKGPKQSWRRRTTLYLRLG